MTNVMLIMTKHYNLPDFFTNYATIGMTFTSLLNWWSWKHFLFGVLTSRRPTVLASLTTPVQPNACP
jgi:hypothetical protein